jgi:hypothetical protein
MASLDEATDRNHQNKGSDMSSYDTTGNTNNQRMVTGLFQDRASAERAYGTVHDRGYTRDDVNLLMSDSTRTTHFADKDTELGSKAAEGAGIGAGIGGTIGAVLAGIAAVGTTLVLPGLGVVVAGPLAAALAGAGAGGITGGLIGALIGAGIPEERAAHYEEGIKNGGIVMGVHARNDEDAAHIHKSWTEQGGSHVIGAGVGVLGGAATGAAIGTAAAGPIGTVTGAVVGGIAGGIAGKGVGEVVNPKAGDDLAEHHLAKGVGAGGGAVAGATVGAVGGPIGMAAGAVIGGLAGGAAGRGAGEVVNPKATDELHDHNLAQGVGGGAGATVGAVVGAAAGPLGVAAGAAIGGMVGGAAGKGVGHMVNPHEENEYWRNSYQTQPYYSPGYTYDDYEPAYALGYNNAGKYQGGYDANESSLSNEWERVKGKSRLNWEQAKFATRAGWHRVERAIPGDFDRDGR